MKLYWSTEAIPELADLPRSQQQYLWSKCHMYGYRHWETWTALLIFAICVVVGITIGITIARIARSNLAFEANIAIIISIIPAIIFAATGYIIYYNVLIRKIRPYIQDYRSKYYDDG
jgi:hypothetical protein